MDFDIDKMHRQSKLKKVFHSALVWMVQILVVVFLAYLFVTYGVQKITMEGESMMTTLNDGDSVIVNKVAYRFTDPKRFDTVVFKQNGTTHSFYSIKRVIGLPGETVQIKEGLVYINGEVLKEKVNVEPMISGGVAHEGLTLEENEYFVLGDNRNNSQDSRFASIGTIVKDNIIGKVWVRTSPFGFLNTMNLVPEEKESSNLETVPSNSPNK